MPFAGEQVDLLAFPPVCLPSLGQSFAGSDGIVAGENHILVETLLNCVLGRLGPDRNWLHFWRTQRNQGVIFYLFLLSWNTFAAKIILEFCNLYIHSVSSQVLIFGESECQANVEENGLDFSQGMLCAEEGTCHVRRNQYFKREKLQKILITGRQRRSPDSRWHFGWHCQSGWISGMCQGDFFRIILPLFVL